MDKTYLGDEARCWRPRSPKQVVIGIRQRNGDLRLVRAADANADTVREIANVNIGGRVEAILAGEATIYPFALKHIPEEKYKTINHSKQYAHGEVHTNTIQPAFSFLKRGIVGTWHKISAKHLPAFLDEICFRFSNRKTPYLFRDVLTRLIQTPHIEYKQLTAKAEELAA